MEENGRLSRAVRWETGSVCWGRLETTARVRRQSSPEYIGGRVLRSPLLTSSYS